MADVDGVRRVALALPRVEEVASEGFDFRVGGRGFVWSWPERRPGRRRVVRSDVALFFTTSGYDGLPLVMLRLTLVGDERLEELITDAWTMRASAEVLALLDPPPTSSG